LKRVMIIAGEASGDLHAGKLIRAVRDVDPEVHFFGIGGDNMRKAGAEIMVDSREMAVVGLVEIWEHREVIFGALNRMRDSISQNPPDLLILVDYPEFNLRLAKHAKKHGVKVLFYISPQIWAWRQYRVRKIKKLVDMMAVVFPFEEAFYHNHNVPVRFVGHPLVNEVKASKPKPELMQEFGLDPGKPVVGLLPGSRRSEIKRLKETILESARLTRSQIENVQFILPLADTLDESQLGDIYEHYSDLGIRVVKNRAYDVITCCDVVLTVSGTVTLEIALLKTPMVIINKVAWLTYIIVSRMLKIDHIGLCNIVADKRIAPELIQNDAIPEKISQQLINLLSNQELRVKMISELSEIETLLGARGGIEKIAGLTLEMLAERS
jgi:lipid-A-disaccharide synthase